MPTLLGLIIVWCDVHGLLVHLHSLLNLTHALQECLLVSTFSPKQ